MRLVAKATHRGRRAEIRIGGNVALHRRIDRFSQCRRCDFEQRVFETRWLEEKKPERTIFLVVASLGVEFQQIAFDRLTEPNRVFVKADDPNFARQFVPVLKIADRLFQTSTRVTKTFFFRIVFVERDRDFAECRAKTDQQIRRTSIASQLLLDEEKFRENLHEMRERERRTRSSGSILLS